MKRRARRGNGKRVRAARLRGTRLRAVVASPIRHVIHLMLENRSFDHMLGAVQAVVPGVDGVDVDATPRTNLSKGVTYRQLPKALRVLRLDPNHETDHVLHQIDGGMANFVDDFAGVHPGSLDFERAQVMAFHALGTLSALHALAKSFVVCDRWHASVPGPTWTNRLFAMSGTSLGRVKMPEGVFQPNIHRYEQASVFRRLEEAGECARVYFHDFPLALLLNDRRTIEGARSMSKFDRFFSDCAGSEARFPAYAFLEPDYLGREGNDDHPPHDVRRGQKLLADVYGAIRANSALWNSTLFVVTYDEHGGFYDHVSPGAAVAPDARTDQYDFRRFGVRVPAVLASPWLDPGVCHALFDHTSVLRLLQHRFGLGELRARTASAKDPLEVLGLRAAPRTDAPKSLPVPLQPKRPRTLPAAAEAAPDPTDHQRAIFSFAAYLDTQTKAAPKARSALAVKLHAGIRAEADVARERARRYLAERGADV